ncbi:ATP-dependent RNA helicase [Actinidia chinensis var. chinensis]|uniref:RNA helicase n=1 Tax=Actinidia chinensis var. chinensis TaxID=1590841 RepID=A0A2R6RGR2_ACTCC|nr:ATP-dependent RNA helicase [Actinidia chinensis var. chinensis]
MNHRHHHPPPHSASFRPQPPSFLVELRSCSGRFGAPDVCSLIKQCDSAPHKYFVNSSGPIAGRLFFRRRTDAAEAVLFFWERRVAGDHLMTPVFEFSDDELNERVKCLFVSHVRSLLHGDVMQSMERKTEALKTEVERLSALLRKPKGLTLHDELQRKRKGVRDEIELNSRRMEEFRSAMKCVLRYIEGNNWEDSSFIHEFVVFQFRDCLDWSRIHHIVMRECRRLDDGLPIYGFRVDILHKLLSEQVIVLIGETGSGKSTQLVQFLADSEIGASGSIVCTQPRKIAAVSLAKRVGEETNGCYGDDSIICYPTYSSIKGFKSKVIFMTDHCLLQHYMKDKSLCGVSCIIVDEAHERSLNTDLLLALLKELLFQRPDLRLIIMSATVDANKLSDYFYGCGTFHVVGRSFPVEINYVPGAYGGTSSTLKPSSGNFAPYVYDVVKLATEIHNSENQGAILAFLTSQMEVEWACENFKSQYAVPLALHGKLSHEEQCRVFQNYTGRRKVIFATNLAETSLTIPGVKYVIDSGMVKESRFDQSTGMNVLRVSRISQSSANQRAGRAGRTESGKCYRIYSYCDYESMSLHQEPEIRKVHLGVAVLRILALGIKNVLEFDFVDAPCAEAIDMAIRNLVQLRAVTLKDDALELTDDGHDIVKLGIEPRLGKIILDCFHHQLHREGVILAAVMANASSIFCRVGTSEDKLKSDCLKIQFCHSDGDLFTLLSVYKEWESMPHGSRNKWCWENSINAKSMRRCHDTVLELENCLKNELGIIVPRNWLWSPHIATDYDKLMKKVILSSLAENIAMFSGYDRLGYELPLTGEHFQLHPSCSLNAYGQKPSWVVFSELLSTPNRYLSCVTAFDYDSLFSLSPPPLFNVLKIQSRKLEVRVITGFGGAVIKRFRGKCNSNLFRLVSRIQTTFMDERIGLEIDSDKNEIHVFATSDDIEKVFSLVRDALECEIKWLRNECLEKCLHRGGQPGVTPPVALFGAGAEIKHLELEQRCLTVDVFHSRGNTIDDKELLMFFENFVPGVCGFHKFIGSGQDGEYNQKWGRITFLTPDAARKAVELNGIEFCGSSLKVTPARAYVGGDHRVSSFPAVRAKVFWPRRYSKGFAVVKCGRNDVGFIIRDCSNILIGGRLLHCEASRKCEDAVVIRGLDRDISEPEILEILRTTTDRKILDLFLVRGAAVDDPPCGACEAALVKEIGPFMPSHSPLSSYCHVKVFPPEPMDCFMRALITFDGRLHLEAAKALHHIVGKVLSGCLPWQKIQCQQMFHSSLSCPAPVYAVIKTQLDSVFNRFKCRSGISYSLEKTEYGSYRVKISANATKTVAELRLPLEPLINGKVVTHAGLSPTILQLLFSRDGIMLVKSLQQETGTYILFDRQNLNVRIFGSEDRIAMAEEKLIQSLLALHEDKQLEIRLRDRVLPQNLMKKVVDKFGPDLSGIKEKVPEAELSLDAKRHVICVCGNKAAKQKAEEVIYEFVHSLNVSGPGEHPGGEASPCSICLCEVEDSYQLSACGHEFCRSCLVDQLESAIKSLDGFPISCTREGCGEHILLMDLKFLLSIEKIEELFRASVGAFVASSRGKYRFCPSPDCPSIYRVAEPEKPGWPFACGACYAETCTRCHLEYHPYVSCERYKEFKQDPDLSLKEWCQGKENVKRCPVCSYTIEKVEGCNHIECRCGKHICWVCLECFCSSDECYAHLRSVHLSIT